MWRNYSLLLIVVGVCLLAIVQNVGYWMRLPEKVATHFNAAGQPDGWMSKDQAVGLMAILQIAIPMSLLATTWLLPRMPASLINMPHREYWLQSERKEETLRYMQQMMLWISILLVLFMTALNHLTFIANMRATGLNMFWFTILMLLFLSAIFALIASMFWHFRVPADEARS